MRKSLGPISRRAAERILAKFRDDLELRRWDLRAMPEPIRYCDFYDRHLAQIEIGISDGYYRRQVQCLKNFTEHLEHTAIYLEEIQVDEIQDFVNARTRAGRSPKTIKEEVGALRRLFEHAILRGHLRLNPCDSPLLKLPKLVRNPFPPIHREQRETAFKDARFGTYYQVLYFTGLRAIDVAALTSDQIDKDFRVIVLDGTRKTDEPAGTPIHESLEELLLNFRGYLFHENPESWYKRAHSSFKRMVVREDWNPRLTIHSFRVAFNNELRNHGTGYEDRKILMTHSSSRVTMDYTHPNLELARTLINQLK